MKKILYTFAIASIAIVTSAKAQVSIGVSIGAPAPVVVAPAAPVWIPSGGASPYYYFPDINCYYDMGVGQYIYMENNAWIYSRAIPPRFARYDFRRARVMPMNQRVFAGRGIPAYGAYRGGGRQVVVNNYGYGGKQHYNNGNHFGNGRGNNGRFENGNHYGQRNGYDNGRRGR